jgi:hypothetical protein
VLKKPLLEADGVEGPDHPHGPLVIHQTSHDRTGAEGQRIAQLVDPAELGGGEEGLEAVEGSPDREAEIELPQITACVHKQVGVILGKQVVDRPHFAHQGEEVGVVEEEDVQPHLDVVAIGILPAADLAPKERTGLIEIDLMTGVHEVHRCSQTGQPRTDNGDPHPFTP